MSDVGFLLEIFLVSLGKQTSGEIVKEKNYVILKGDRI